MSWNNYIIQHLSVYLTLALLISTTGNKATGQINHHIKERSKKIFNLMEQYNELIDKLPSHVQKPKKLEKKPITELCLGDDFWELERFTSKEQWATDSQIRNGIMGMHSYSRAIEEITILNSEVSSYYTWLSTRMNGIERILHVVKRFSPIGTKVLELGIQSAGALKQLDRLTEISLDSDKFPEVLNNLSRIFISRILLTLIQEITKQSAERLIKWKETLSIIQNGSSLGPSYVLTDEPISLENMMADLILAAECEHNELDITSDKSDVIGNEDIESDSIDE